MFQASRTGNPLTGVLRILVLLESTFEILPLVCSHIIAASRFGFVSKSGSFCKINLESIFTALIGSCLFGMSMSELLLNVAFLDICI